MEKGSSKEQHLSEIESFCNVITTVQKFGVSNSKKKIFSLYIQQGCIKLIKSKSIDMYAVKQCMKNQRILKRNCT